MKRSFRIGKKQRARIEEAVERAEARTSGEIVPVILSSSGDYRWTNWFWGFLLLFTASGVLWWATSSAPWAMSAHEWLKDRTDYSFWSITVQDALLVQACAAFLGFALGYLGPFRRAVVPAKTAAENAHRQALAHFMAAGLTETRDRTGVLVFISHFERRVEILADSGIDSRVPAGYWKKAGEQIIEGIHRGKVVDALVKVIDDIGSQLESAAPRRADDVNELPNRLWTSTSSPPELPPIESAQPPGEEPEPPRSPLPPLPPHPAGGFGADEPGEPEESTRTSEMDLSELPDAPSPQSGETEPTSWDIDLEKWSEEDPDKKKS